MKAQNFIVLFLLALVISTGSCNKKKARVAAPSGSGFGSTIPEVEELDLKNCYGEFYFGEYLEIGKAMPVRIRNPVDVLFYSKPITDPAKRSIDIGKVSVSGVILHRSSPYSDVYYKDTTYQLVSLPAFEFISFGNAGNPGFKFSYDSGSPVFADTSSIPSEISRSQDLKLILKKITDTDSLLFTFKGNSHNKPFMQRVFVGTNKEVTLDMKREDIAAITGPNETAVISIRLSKKVLVYAAGRAYLVQSVKIYEKGIHVSF